LFITFGLATGMASGLQLVLLFCQFTEVHLGVSLRSHWANFFHFRCHFFIAPLAVVSQWTALFICTTILHLSL